MTTPCEEKGYKEGQVFEVIKKDSGNIFSKGSLVVLVKDDHTTTPFFDGIEGHADATDLNSRVVPLHKVKRIYPPEEESKMVEVVCEGKTVEISRESAKALNLI